MCLSACCFVIFLDCRCFPADFHLGLHPALGLSLKLGAFLSPVHLPCIEIGVSLPGAPVGRNSDNPASGGVVRHRKQSNATFGV